MDWVDEYLDMTITKVLAECQRMPKGIPYIPEKGRYLDMAQKDISWWTNGFYGGLLWQLYHYTGEEEFRLRAEEIEAELDQAMDDFVGLHHDVGFMWLHTAVANYRKTGSEKSQLRGLKAASLLASRFNLQGSFLRAWNEDKTGWIIIDSMMNIPLLYWASQETKDPRFEQLAKAHANTVEQYLIRKDGSSGHIASFDPITGSFIEQIGGQGYDADSAWSRGQSWAVYGFSLSYKYTQESHYLDTAIAVANAFLTNVAESGYIPKIDFKAPATTQDHDTSAGLIASCGLLEIAKYVPQPQKELYTQGAIKIIRQTLEQFGNFDPEVDGIVYGGAVAYHDELGKDVSLVYSDYFMVEALLKLKQAELDLW
ncbi:glycoside hydrolase family 88 protein [Enterococcus asini]|uniref:glycoside hydrolase family 88 protein n=1 Tax=Enterococcus asini TaxID=57732 RepID=UPI0032E4912F